MCCNKMCIRDREGTDAHPVPSHPDSEMLGSLPGGNRLLDSFKYIQLNPPENKKSACHSRKENGKRLLKFHILFFLCAGLLAFLGLFLPDTPVSYTHLGSRQQSAP